MSAADKTADGSVDILAQVEAIRVKVADEIRVLEAQYSVVVQERAEYNSAQLIPHDQRRIRMASLQTDMAEVQANYEYQLAEATSEEQRAALRTALAAFQETNKRDREELQRVLDLGMLEQARFKIRLYKVRSQINAIKDRWEIIRVKLEVLNYNTAKIAELTRSQPMTPSETLFKTTEIERIKRDSVFILTSELPIAVREYTRLSG